MGTLRYAYYEYYSHFCSWKYTKDLNPSLHYSIWKGRAGKFAIGGRSPDTFVGSTKAINLSRIPELWACRILRFILSAILSQYAGNAPPVPLLDGKGFNIVNPLWAAQEYKPKAIEALKDSPDPEIRAYNVAAKQKGQVVQAAQRREAQLQNALKGGPKTLGVKGGHYRFGIGCLQIACELPRAKAQIWGVKDGDEINVVYDLLDTGRHPHTYAPRARLDGLGARLGVKITGTTGRGQPFSHWMVTNFHLGLYSARELV